MRYERIREAFELDNDDDESESEGEGQDESLLAD